MAIPSKDQDKQKSNASLQPRNDGDTTTATMAPPAFQLEAEGEQEAQAPTQAQTKRTPPQTAQEMLAGIDPDLPQKQPELRKEFNESMLFILSFWRANYPDHYKSMQDEVISKFGDTGKELVIRDSLLAGFDAEEGLSVTDPKSVTGLTKDKYVSSKKAMANMTSCITVAQSLLKKSFESRSDIDIEKTHGWKWIPEKRDENKKIISYGKAVKETYKSTSYDFYAKQKAEETGSWNPASPDMTGRPQISDMYLLKNLGNGNQSHIGYIKRIEKVSDPNFEIWHTFDGGQPVGPNIDTYNPDGSRTNLRIYDKKKNTLTVSPKRAMELRGETPDPELAKVKVNQDGEEKGLMGWIDLAKLIHSEKKETVE